MSQTKAEKKTRIRLSPDARVSMILDHAARIVSEEGVSVLTMERLGKEAGISKALVYNYFPNLTELLRTLLTREYRHLRKLQFEATKSAQTLEQLVRSVTHVYLTYIEERGLLIERLAVEPTVANSGDPTEYSRETAVEFLADILVKNFGIDKEIAIPAVDISYGLPAAAGHYITHHEIDLQTIEDITVTMILGSIDAIQKRYDAAFKKLTR